LNDAEDCRQEEQGCEGSGNQATNDRASEWCCFLAALADRESHRKHSRNHGQAGHGHRPRLLSRSRSCCGNRFGSVATILFSERDQQDCVRYGNPNSHDRAHEAFKVQRRTCEQQHEDGSHKYSRDAGDDHQRQAERLKIRRQQEQNHDHGQGKADGQLGEDLLERIHVAAHLGQYAARC
jgi:hypothetical protein